MPAISKRGLNWKVVKLLGSACLVVALAFFLYVWKLGTLTSGLSSSEVSARNDSQSVHLVLHNPVNAPHKIIQAVFQHLGHHGAFWMRSASVFFVLVFLLSFYFLARNWFGSFVGALATLLLASTPWAIILARSATPDIMLLAPIPVIAAFNWFSRTKKHQVLALVSLVVSTGLSLYTPGLAWLLVLGAAIAAKKLLPALRKVSPVILSLNCLLFAVLVLPLGIGIAHTPSTVKTLLLIPASWQSMVDVAKSIVWAALALVWKTPRHIDTIIGRLSILTITQTILGGLGMYAMLLKARRKTYWLLALIVFGIIAAGVNSNLSLLTLSLPGAIIFIAAGLRYLYIEWFSIFPRNPLPKGLALVLISLVAALQLFYGLRYSLVAWPRTVDTHKAYVLK